MPNVFATVQYGQKAEFSFLCFGSFWLCFTASLTTHSRLTAASTAIIAVYFRGLTFSTWSQILWSPDFAKNTIFFKAEHAIRIQVVSWIKLVAKCIMVYLITMSLEDMTPLQLLQPPTCMIFPGSRGHEDCFSLTIYFMLFLHYLLASFNLISLILTVVAGNLVMLWRKLHCGHRNTFGSDKNSLSLFTEKNPVLEKMWKWVGDKGEEKIRPFMLCSVCPFSIFLSFG